MSLFYYSPFSLYPNASINSQHRSEPVEGFNFKLSYEGENIYCSYVLHPELGDPTPKIFIENIQRNLPYVLIENLREEYILKSSQRYFLDYINHELQSHATIPKGSSIDEVLKSAQAKYRQGFRRLKFKVNLEFFRDQAYYVHLLNEYKDLEVIFDFNSSGTLIDFKNLKWEKSILERAFWEDPVGLDLDSLGTIKSMGYRLVLDQKDMLHHQRLIPYSDLFEIISVKPSKESVREVMDLFPKSRILITTNMGDEMDHVISAHWANHVFTKYTDRFFGSGLYTRCFFKDDAVTLNPFTRSGSRMNNEDHPKVRSSFLDLENRDILRGWGLDKQMTRKEWIQLKDVRIEF